MPESSVNLGSINVDVGLKTGGLTAGVATVTKAARTIKTALAEIDGAKVGEKMAASLPKVGTMLAGVSAGIAAVGLTAVKMAGDYQASMTRIGNNTTMTNAQIQQMRDTVIKFGKESGASFDDLAEGFMHIANYGYKGADAVNILHEAMKSSVATGALTANTANVLAGVLHEFGIKATDAGKAMNVIHLAAAAGNSELNDWTAAAGKAYGVAANLKIPLTDVSAAMSALTQHGYDVYDAAVQVTDIMLHMVHPTKQAKDEIVKLKNATGIDLSQAFSMAGLGALSLKGVLALVAKATKGNAAEVYNLIGAQRGGRGAMSLIGTAADDYRQRLIQLSEAQSGQLDPTTVGYTRSLKTLNNEIARAANEIRADFIPVGMKLMPVFQDAIPLIRTTASVLSTLLDDFAGLPKPIQETTIAIGALSLGVKALDIGLGIGGGAGLIGGLTKVKELMAVTPSSGTLGEILLGGGSVASVGLLAKLGAPLNWAVGGDMAGAAVLPRLLGGALPLAGVGAGMLGDGYLGYKIAGQQFAKSNAAGRGLATVDLSPYIDKMASIRRAHPSDYANRPDYQTALDMFDRMGGKYGRQQSTEGAGNTFVAAMAKHIGEATGIQCGAAVTKALHEAGFTGTASSLAKAAIANPSRRLHPNAPFGDLPPGTIVYFPGHGGSVGRDPSEHFGVAGGIGAGGLQTILESTTAGGHGRHYQDSRTLAQIAAEHGGRYYAFSPGTAAGKAPAAAGAGGGGAAASIDPAALADLKKRAYDLTHSDYDNARYDAGQQYAADKKVDPKLAMATYQASLKEIAKEQATAQAQALAKLKAHHAEVEKQIAAHNKKVAAMVGAELSAADKAQSASAKFITDSWQAQYTQQERDAKAHAAALAKSQKEGIKDLSALAGADLKAGTFSTDLSPYDGSLPPQRRGGKQTLAQRDDDGFSWIGTSITDSLEKGAEKFKNFHSFFAEETVSMESIWKRAITQMILDWGMLQLAGVSGGGFGGIFKHQIAQSGGANPLGMLAGLFGHHGSGTGASAGGAAIPTDPGMGGAKGSGGAGGLGSILGMGKLIPGLGAAMPWVAGGLALNSLLGNPLKKLFHFAGGGIVPGVGHSDSVPAMLTPGERVLTKEQQRGLGASRPITINHYGDNHGIDDVAAMHQAMAWHVKSALSVVTPGV
jgi:TP901 family phage tail tape measure protein